MHLIASILRATLGLLEELGQVRRLMLAGDVPPSLAVRLARPYSKGLTLKKLEAKCIRSFKAS